MKSELEIKERLDWMIPATIGEVEKAIELLPYDQKGYIAALKWILEE